jgi:5-methylcytosine-specific restriction endonuclease McrA
MSSLKWSGNLRAQQEADADFAKLLPKSKPPSRRKTRTRKQKLATGLPHHQSKKKAFIHPHVPYAKYLKSNWWKTKRKQVLKAVGRKCQRCGATRGLQVHHLHYNTLWREKNTDLEVLCAACHRHEHQTIIDQNAHLDSIARGG